MESRQPRGNVSDRPCPFECGKTYVVCTSANTRGECPQSHGARLCDDGVGDRTQGSGVHERDEDSEDSLCVVCAAVLVDGRANAEEDEESTVDGGASEEDVAASKVGT